MDAKEIDKIRTEERENFLKQIREEDEDYMHDEAFYTRIYISKEWWNSVKEEWLKVKRNEYTDTCEKAAKEVESWPEWKRNIKL